MYKSIEISKENSNQFKKFLKENNFEYEASECGIHIHFEIEINPNDKPKEEYIMNFIEKSLLKN